MKYNIKDIWTGIVWIIAIIMLNSNFGIAQKNLQDGYVVKASGDTIKGKIDYKNWERNPEFIQFTSNETGFTETLGPLDLTSFYVEDEYFISKILTVDKSPFAINELMLNAIPYDKERKLVKDTVFLSVLVRGKLDLFYLQDDNDKPHYFVENESVKIDELILHHYKVDVIEFARTKTIIRKNERYKGQLAYYFRDCPSLVKKSQKLQFTTKDISNMIYQYNDCQ